MDGEGGAFLFLLVTFSQDSHDFSQHWEKMRDFLGKRGMIFPFSLHFNPLFLLLLIFSQEMPDFFPKTWVFRGSCGKSIVLPLFSQYFCSVEETRQR